MLKTENSLRSQGLTCIAIDKPTRAKLKVLAEAEGLPLSHYLRVMADRELTNKSIPMPTGILSGVGERGLSEALGDVKRMIALAIALPEMVLRGSKHYNEVYQLRVSDIDELELRTGEIIQSLRERATQGAGDKQLSLNEGVSGQSS